MQKLDFIKEKITLNEGINNSREERSSSKNNDSNIGFQFFRKDQDVQGKNIINKNFDRQNNFNKQFQSILHHAKVVVRDARSGSFSVRLYPESLGRVNINFDLDQGILTGKFLVDNREAKEVLWNNIYMLKEKLEESGVSVGEFQVNVREEQNGTSDKGEEETPSFTIDQDSIMDKSHGYEQNSSSLHDGEIDMII